MLASHDSDLFPPWPLHKIYPCLQNFATEEGHPPFTGPPGQAGQEPVTISRHQGWALRPLAFWLRPSGEASMLQGMAVIDYTWPDPKRIHKSMTTRISSTSTKP